MSTPPLFLCDRADLLAHDTVRLGGPEGRHAATVRRLAPGERVDLTDGAGLLARCEVHEAARDTLTCRVLERVEVPAPQPRLVVVQALAKGGRDEAAVEAMTEVGVDAIVPWQAARSIARWRERSLERWRATAREAAKQARRAWVPEVADVAGADAVARLLAEAALGVVLHGQAEQPLSALDLPTAGDVVVVVGPEGGITDEELAAFTAAGGRTCRLGPTVLRTSTAGVAAAAVLSARGGRWS